MDLRILGWRYSNIRGGLRNVQVELGSPASRWTLIQMPNGTGKTTTMALLRAVLAGERLSPSAVREFRPSDDTDRGEFELRLAIQDRLYRLLLRLDYREGTASYWTARAELTSGGLEEGRNLPDELERLITPAFARLFVFDGEMAKEIRNPGAERAAEAVRTLYRLDRLRDLTQQVSRLVTEEQQRAAAISRAETAQGLKQLQSRYETARDTYADLTRRERQVRDRIRENGERKAGLEARKTERIQLDEGLRGRLQEVTDARQVLEGQIAELAKRILAALRNPAILHPRVLERLRALGGRMDRLKLPKTMSAEFFQELAEHTECICGRPIGETERQTIRERAHEYLAENEISVINAMKSAVRHSDAEPAELTNYAATLREHLRERQRLATRLDQLEAERVAAGDDELMELHRELDSVEGQLKADQAALELLTTRDPLVQRANTLDWKSNIPLCKVEMNQREERCHTATRTWQFLVKARETESIIRDIEQAAFDRLRERVRIATNEKLRTLVPSEDLRVSRIGGAIELGSSGLAAKGGVSEGQSLAVAYAFLTSLFQDAPYRLPFIVDSPAISLDVAVRREVGELVPELFDQMIMFVISSERPGFADAFYPRDGVRYITLWRSSEEATEVSYDSDVFRTFHDQDDRSNMPGDVETAAEIAGGAR